MPSKKNHSVAICYTSVYDGKYLHGKNAELTDGPSFEDKSED